MTWPWPPPPIHLKGTSAAPSYLTTSLINSTKSTTPTIPFHGPPPPPPQPPPAPNITSYVGVSDTNFTSITSFQLKGRRAWCKFVIIGSSVGKTKKPSKQLMKKPIQMPTNKSTTPTIPSHDSLPPPPPQPPPAPNITPPIKVSDTNSASITSFQLKGRSIWFEFIIIGSSWPLCKTKEPTKQLMKKPIQTPTIKSTTPTSPSHGYLPPPPQLPPVPIIPPSVWVSDTNFASITAVQLRGRDEAEIPSPKLFKSHHHLQPQTSPKILTDCIT